MLPHMQQQWDLLSSTHFSLKQKGRDLWMPSLPCTSRHVRVVHGTGCLELVHDDMRELLISPDRTRPCHFGTQPVLEHGVSTDAQERADLHREFVLVSRGETV